MSKFDIVAEQINSTVNINALLLVLCRKGLITTEEFLVAKAEASTEFKKDFPELFK